MVLRPCARSARSRASPRCALRLPAASGISVPMRSAARRHGSTRASWCAILPPCSPESPARRPADSAMLPPTSRRPAGRSATATSTGCRIASPPASPAGASAAATSSRSCCRPGPSTSSRTSPRPRSAPSPPASTTSSPPPSATPSSTSRNRRSCSRRPSSHPRPTSPAIAVEPAADRRRRAARAAGRRRRPRPRARSRRVRSRSSSPRARPACPRARSTPTASSSSSPPPTSATSGAAGRRSFTGTSFAHLGFMTKLPGNLMRGGTTFIMQRWRAHDALELLARERMVTRRRRADPARADARRRRLRHVRPRERAVHRRRRRSGDARASRPRRAPASVPRSPRATRAPRPASASAPRSTIPTRTRS